MFKSASILSLVVLTAFTGQKTFAKAPAKAIELVTRESLRELKLSPQLSKTLRDFDPSFKPLKESDFISEAIALFGPDETQAPMIAEADFNGDNKLDLAFFGKSNSNYSALMAINKDDGTWDIIPVVSYSSEEKFIQKGAKLKIYLSVFNKQKLTFIKKSLSPRAGLQLETYLGPTTTYYFDDHEIKVYSSEK